MDSKRLNVFDARIISILVGGNHQRFCVVKGVLSLRKKREKQKFAKKIKAHKAEQLLGIECTSKTPIHVKNLVWVGIKTTKARPL